MLSLPEPSDSERLPQGDYTSAQAWGIPEAEALLWTGALPSDVWPVSPSLPGNLPPVNVQQTIAQVFDRLGLPQPLRSDTSEAAQEASDTAQPNEAVASLNDDEQQRLARLREDIAGNGYLDDDNHDPTARWWEFLRREYEAGRLTEHDVHVKGLSEV